MTDLKEAIKKILHPEEFLHPPPQISMASEKEPSEGSRTDAGFESRSSEGMHTLRGDSNLAITENDLKKLQEIMKIPGYWRWVCHGDTKRSFYIARVPDKSSRVTYEQMTEDLWEIKKDMQMVREIKKIDPNAKNFGAVMDEFKKKVAKLRSDGK